MNTLQDRIRGSLIGGAIGDALGYPVEFMSLNAIKQKYGDKGYFDYQEYNKEGKAVISDDTQMTLFTANGLLNYITRITITNGFHWNTLLEFITLAYKDWLKTQEGVDNYFHRDPFKCWIRDIEELNVCRAPGNTCMSALRSLQWKKEAENDSKGCGGVMRVAPVGLLAAADKDSYIKDWYGHEVVRREWTEEDVVRLGGECARITHKHPLGYLPAAFQADLIYYIVYSEVPITFSVLEGYIGAVYADVCRVYTTDREQQELKALWMLIDKAITLAAEWESDTECIRQLGEGWTGDEALAIAIYCTLKHIDDFGMAVAAAVNHDGDSDSTGAVCGNLMGAIVGYESILSRLTNDLELKELILEIADDLVSGFLPEDEKWRTKYIDKDFYMEEKYSEVWRFVFQSKSRYHIMPRALRAYEARKLICQISSKNDDHVNGNLWYKLALKVYDTETFNPIQPLSYERLEDDPEGLFLEKELRPQAAWYDGCDDPKYAPKHNKRVFKLNIYCFEGKNPVIAVRKDGHGRIGNELQAGLFPYHEPDIASRYPDWEFYFMDFSSADVNYAVFTNELEKEFSVEIAHLWEDGTLHRIYYLYY